MQTTAEEPTATEPVPPAETTPTSGATIAGRVKRKRGPRRGPGTAAAERPKPQRHVASVELLIGPGEPEPDGIVCSIYWAQWAREAMLAGVARPCVEFAAVWRSLWRSGIYPPRDEGRRSGMRVCVMCGRDCPASAVQSDYCVDCQSNRSAPSEEEVGRLCEGSQIVERLLQFVRTREEFMVLEYLKDGAQLKAESDAELRREIRRFHKGQWRPEAFGARRVRRRELNIRGT